MGDTPGPKDIVIAVMGITGVGKSTFVNYLSREDVEISSKLHSCTQDIKAYRCSLPSIPRFFLVDTPGFDDSERSDADVLKQLAKHLAKAYDSDIRLTGLIYLHRIMDTRFGGASGRNLRTFKKLTGTNNLGSVVLATTFWKVPLSADDVNRESQLSADERFGWSKMLSEGAKSMRQDNDYISAEAIVRYLIDRKKPVELKIQTEMVLEGKSVSQTEAGSDIVSEMRKAHEEAMARLRKDLMDAIQDRDKAWQMELEAERTRRQRAIAYNERGLRERFGDWWDDVDCVVM